MIKIVNKAINPGLLQEELDILGLLSLMRSIGWAGFDHLPDGQRYVPFVSRQVIGSSSINQVRTEDFADPGEIRFTFSRVLTVQEDTDLDALLVAHDATGFSAEQTRQVQDSTDLASLLATDFPAYKVHIRNWDTYTNAQRIAATKEMFLTLGKGLRALLRGGGVDI